MLQYVAVCCTMLQYAAVCCNVGLASLLCFHMCDMPYDYFTCVTRLMTNLHVRHDCYMCRRVFAEFVRLLCFHMLSLCWVMSHVWMERALVAVCCSVLQCIAVCCSVLQFFAGLVRQLCFHMLSHVAYMRQSSVCYIVLQCVAVCCGMFQYVAVLCWACQTAVVSHAESCHIYENVVRKLQCVLQCVVVCCSALQCVAGCCRVLQYVAVHCSALLPLPGCCVPICVTCPEPIDMCDMTHSCVWHGSFICVTWLIHMCDMTHSCGGEKLLNKQGLNTYTLPLYIPYINMDMI